MTPPPRKILGCPICGTAVSGLEQNCPTCGSEFPESVRFECPFCGGGVPRSATKCPGCGIIFDALKAGSESEGQADVKENVTKVDGALSSLDEMVSYICGSCGGILEGPDAECPECGPKPTETPSQPSEQGSQQTSADDRTEVPSAAEGAEQAKVRRVLKSPSAPPARVLTKEIDEAEKSLDSLSAVAGQLKPGILAGPPPEKRQVGEGFSNGLGRTNGKGRTNGRTNGRINGKTNGKTNGRTNGRINGRTNGRTNGQDFVNGTGVPGRQRGDMRSTPFSRIFGTPAGMRIAALFVIVILVISAFVALSFRPASSPYTIDGDFGDWADAETMTLSSPTGPPAADVVEWDFEVRGSDVYMYARTDGLAFDTSAVSSLYLFLDTDSDNRTGYLAYEMGADYLMELSGWNRTIGSTHLYVYGSDTDMYDWNSWERIGSVDSAVFGSEMEAVARIGAVGISSKAMLVAQDNTDGCAESVPVPASGGVLVVQQIVPEDLVASGIVPFSDSATLLMLRFTCQGASGSVQQVTPTVIGPEVSSSLPPFEISPGESHMVDVTVDTTLMSAGDLASAWLAVSGIQSSFSSVMVLGDGSRAYVSSAPDNVQIDGAFADWDNRTCPDSDAVPILNEDIDITAVGNANDPENSYFYVGVLGEIVCGKSVPAFRYVPVYDGGGGIPTQPPRKTGEDYFRIYVDTDMNNSTGESVSASGKQIGAEKMIEVSGLYGHVTGSRVLEFQGLAWVEVDEPVLVGKDARRMEVGVGQLSPGNGTDYDFVVESSDWQSRSDVAILQQGGTRAAVSSLGGGFDIERWIVDSGTSSMYATSMSYQRKLFHDGTNFWSIYFDGSNTICRYSSDGGLTWTSRGSIFTTSGVEYASLWYDSTNSLVYVVGDRSTASTNVYLQRGSVTPGTATITWAGSDSTLATSLNTLADKNTFISKDASGYLWVFSSNKSNSQPVRYDLSAFKSASTDSISSWLYSGNMLTADSTSASLKGSILPAGSGSDVWAVYNYDKKVSSKKCTSGTWGAEENIFTGSGTAETFVNSAPVSAVVGASGVVHAVYGDGNEDTSKNSKPYIQYTSNSGSGWSAEVRLDTVTGENGNQYPTISLNSATGDLYAFWVQMDNNNIVAKKYSSSTWSFVDLGSQTTYTKTYLTSVYSASQENRICWLWTQNTSAPIQVYFDKIPEFSDIVYPSVGVLAIIFILTYRTRVRKKQ